MENRFYVIEERLDWDDTGIGQYNYKTSIKETFKSGVCLFKGTKDECEDYCIENRIEL